MGDDRVRPFDTLFHRHSGPPCLLSIIRTIIRPIPPFCSQKEIKWLAIAVIKSSYLSARHVPGTGLSCPIGIACRIPYTHFHYTVN